MTETQTLLLIYGLGVIGTIGFIEWIKELIKAIAIKNPIGLLASILSLSFSCIIGLTAKLILFSDFHWLMVFPLIIGALSPIQLGYQIIIQGVPALLDSAFAAVSSFMSSAVAQSANKISLNNDDEDITARLPVDYTVEDNIDANSEEK